jgi:phosphatidylethanolamine/phosphatidyl-N-methylethanolamine N-methyltransferase
MNEHLVFLGRFVRSPRTVGAVSPSSRALAAEMVRGLDFSGTSRVVELGPGTGVITRAIAAQLGPEAHALSIDIEPAFVAEIARRYPTIEAVCGSAADLEALLRARSMFPADHIVSGLPFASLPGEVTSSILDAIGASLRSGGTFTTFQYMNGYPTPLARSFRRAMTERMGGPPVRRSVWRNIPPAFVMTWHHQ